MCSLFRVGPEQPRDLIGTGENGSPNSSPSRPENQLLNQPRVGFWSATSCWTGAGKPASWATLVGTQRENSMGAQAAPERDKAR